MGSRPMSSRHALGSYRNVRGAFVLASSSFGLHVLYVARPTLGPGNTRLYHHACETAIRARKIRCYIINFVIQPPEHLDAIWTAWTFKVSSVRALRRRIKQDERWVACFLSWLLGCRFFSQDYVLVGLRSGLKTREKSPLSVTLSHSYPTATTLSPAGLGHGGSSTCQTQCFPLLQCRVCGGKS